MVVSCNINASLPSPIYPLFLASCILQYNMIYVFTQISGLFGRTFSAAFTNTQADSPENHMYPEAETLM